MRVLKHRAACFIIAIDSIAEGTILDARLVPPTAQNQGVIEEDLRAVATANLDRDEETLKAVCEQSIRNHDPCISCAAHFLQLRVHRE